MGRGVRTVGICSAIIRLGFNWACFSFVLEMIRGVGDPVGGLVFGAFGRAVRGEEGLVHLRLLFHFLDRPLAPSNQGVLQPVGGAG